MSDSVDLGELLKQAQAMQSQLMDAQAAVAEQEVEGVAGGGAVRISASGSMEFRSVRIDPAALAEGDSALLEDLVLAALHDVVAKAAELNSSALGGFTGLGDLLG